MYDNCNIRAYPALEPPTPYPLPLVFLHSSPNLPRPSLIFPVPCRILPRVFPASSPFLPLIFPFERYDIFCSSNLCYIGYMNPEKIARIHAELVEGLTISRGTRRSQIRTLYGSIIEARRAGKSYPEIVNVLNSHGITISTSQLYKELCIIRKETDPTNSNTQKAKAGSKPHPPSPPQSTVSHDPRDLDNIMGKRPDLSKYAKAAKESSSK